MKKFGIFAIPAILFFFPGTAAEEANFIANGDFSKTRSVPQSMLTEKCKAEDGKWLDHWRAVDGKFRVVEEKTGNSLGIADGTVWQTLKLPADAVGWTTVRFKTKGKGTLSVRIVHYDAKMKNQENQTVSKQFAVDSENEWKPFSLDYKCVPEMTRRLSIAVNGGEILLSDVRMSSSKEPSAKPAEGARDGSSLSDSAPARFSAEAREVLAGKRTEAKASWFGFDPDDATDAFQAALDSKAKKVIIDNTGSPWIIARPLRFVSNQEIVFQDGVTVQSKPGGFRKIGDPLFQLREVSNVKLRGEGKVRCMMDKDEYEKRKGPKEVMGARHILNISRSNNISVENISFERAGGDGIYISGGSKDVLIDKVVCTDNYRLGMAVISAENLTVRNSVFRNSRGGQPEGGIDFEPNRPNEKLVNCLVENCVFENNPRGNGINLSPNNLSASTAPVSITIKDCVFRNNANSFFIYTTNGRNRSDPKGEIHIINCKMEEPVLFSNPIDGTVQVRFKDCVITGKPNRKDSFFNLRCEKGAGKKIGGVEFDNVTLIDNSENGVAPVTVSVSGLTKGIADSITGTLNVTRQGKTAPFDLNAYLEEQRQYFSKIAALVPGTVKDIASLRPSGEFQPRKGNSSLYTRGCTFLQYCEQGREVVFTSGILKAGYNAGAVITVSDPDGKTAAVFKHPAPAQNEPEFLQHKFVPAKTGIHTLKCESINCFDITSSAPGSALIADEQGIRFLVPGGRVYFRVPEGVGTFSVGVGGGVDAKLCDPDGRPVASAAAKGDIVILEGKRSDASRSEIWSIGLSQSKWKVTLVLFDPLLPLVSTNPSTILR